MLRKSAGTRGRGSSLTSWVVEALTLVEDAFMKEASAVEEALVLVAEGFGVVTIAGNGLSVVFEVPVVVLAVPVELVAGAVTGTFTLVVVGIGAVFVVVIVLMAG